MEDDSILRLASFLAVFLCIAVAELKWPRRPLVASKRQRWFCNLSLVTIDTALVRLAIPLMPFGMAELASVKGWGLFNLLAAPHWLESAAAILMLDLLIYLQHQSFHRIPLFWRFHRMHHTDLDLDVSSGNRFHPIEILLSLVIKIAAVLLIGASAASVVIFEVVLNASSLFNHGNVNIPTNIDKWLRCLVVTPDMHRVHHSIFPRETDSNFGFNFPWWDRLFGTYTNQPRDGHFDMLIGLKEFQNQNKLGLAYLLLLPFRGRGG